MLSKEVKMIMEEKFDQNKNYKEILHNVEKNNNKKNIYFKVTRYALLPLCAAVIVVIVTITTIKNNNNKLKSEVTIAETNNVNNINDSQIMQSNVTENFIENTDSNKIENEEKNTNIQIDNSDNVIVKDHNKIIEKEPTSITIAKEVYKRIECGEASWAVNPNIPSNLINNISSVVKVKIISINDAEMLPKQQNFNDPYKAYTPVEMQILDNIYGNNLSGKIKAYLTGGKIQIAKLQNSLSEEQLKNLGINALSSKDRLKYIHYTTSYDYDLTIGNEYIIIVKQVNGNLYKISENGYDIFDIETYKNVLTGQKLEIKN